MEKKRIRIAHKNFKSVRKNKEDEEKLIKSLNEKITALEYYKNEEETRKKQDEVLLELKTAISKNYDGIKKQLLELGYKENNEEYFAFC